MRHKPSGFQFRPISGQVSVPFPKLPDVLFQLLALGMGPDLMDGAVRVEKVRVPFVGHGPVEQSVQIVDVHVQVLGGLHDPMDVPGKARGFKVYFEIL